MPALPRTGAELAVPNLPIPVHGVSIIGATVFSPAQLQGVVAGLAHGAQPLPRLEAARRALLDLYRGHGYVLTTVSMDIDAQGNVAFVVTEGRIVAVKLSRDIGPAGSMVLTFLDHLTKAGPVREAQLEHWLLLAQQIPGISVHAVLQADSSDPGALTLVADVSRQAVSGLLTVDNRGFQDAGPAEGLLVGDFNSVTAHGDQTEISLFHTSGNTDNFGQVSESFYLGNSGLRLKLYGGAGRAQPSGTLREANYRSQLTVFGAELIYPLRLRRTEALTLFGHFDAVQSVINTSGALTSQDSLRVARVETSYAWEDLWAGTSHDAVNVGDLQFSQGLPLFGASADGRAAPPAGRASEKLDFWKIAASLSRTQTLWQPLPASSLALHLAAGGQYTGDILPSAEEYYLGGSRITRGYYSGEVTGDNGAFATAELQFNTGYDFTLFSHDAPLGVQLYSFYDWGESWSNLHTDSNHRLASYGGGVRMGLTRALEFDAEVTRRLVTQLNAQSSGVKPLSDTVFYWAVTARY